MKNRTYLWVGLAVFVVLVVGSIALLSGVGKEVLAPDTAIHIVGATGGGKENFLADAEIAGILKDKYNIKVTHVTWSNGKITDQELAKDTANVYDFAFFSDQRYYEQYQTANNQRYKKHKGYIALNTPIVVYSWKPVAEVLSKAGIVTQRDGVYTISDMEKLLEAIGRQQKWTDISPTDSPVYANRNPINIISVDPVTSSPGATYYGLLAAIMDPTNRTGQITQETLQRLQAFYQQAGFLTFTPADLFDQYLRIGLGTYPLIVDYEKSLIDWAISSPAGYERIKDRIAVLYPEPTIWNSHCILSFSENGSILVDALEKDQRIQEIAFQRYGFRMGLSTAYDNSASFDTAQGPIQIPGIPGEILSVVPSLRMEGYNKIVSALKETLTQ